MARDPNWPSLTNQEAARMRKIEARVFASEREPAKSTKKPAKKKPAKKSTKKRRR